ncbi:DedA family protein [Leeia sp.]|uniref:DedA family protein n=1 Tax=Leeia sp. TaxID=2884678 RepID=UPI0035AE2984
MDTIWLLIDFILHVDTHLRELFNQHGVWVYGILFLIVFCETGLVVTPFLPGDSLLFAAGALTVGTTLSPHLLAASLIVAALLGDNVNYALGRWLGQRLFAKPDSRLFRREYLERTHAFFERHGGRAIILARFIPIVRTYIPFTAGAGHMPYRQFLLYSVLGALSWVLLLVYLGHFFGNQPFVRANFSLLVLGIIALSVLPVVVAFVRQRLART